MPETLTMAKNVVTTADGSKQTLPTEIKEQSSTKTSVYEQGKLIYDGATGEGSRPGGSSAGPGGSLNEMLKWSIEHSDPAELQRRAVEGAAPPSQIDKEIIDMLLGQPTVAKMRECLGKLEQDALVADGGLDEACAALEELEYYAEDLDLALDLTKIGGFAALRRCCAIGLLGDDEPGGDAAGKAAAAAVAAAPEEAAAMREAACGVLAAMVQNNPKVAHTARRVGIPQLLLALLSGGGTGVEAERVGGIAVVRKALLALSALLRTAAEPAVAEGASQRTLAAAAAADAPAVEVGDVQDEDDAPDVLPLALPTLRPLMAHADLKLRRRALFLFASLAAASPSSLATVSTAADDALLTSLLGALTDDDEDVRTQTSRLLLTLSGAADVPKRLAAAGGAEACARALARSAAMAVTDRDPEEVGRITRLAAAL